MGNWLDDVLREEMPADIVKAEPVPIEETGGEVLVQRVVDQLFEESTKVVAAAMRFADIEVGATEVPRAWVAEMGQEEAEKAFRIAQFAQMSKKEAPIGLELAARLATGITKSKMERDNADRPINIAFVRFERTEKSFPEVIVEDQDGKPKRKRKPRP